MTESSDAELCEATIYLLSTQQRDGSWGSVKPGDDPYSILHPVWVATQCLRDRSFIVDGPRSAAKQWDEHIANLLRNTNSFGTSSKSKKGNKLRNAARRVTGKNR